MHEWLSRLAKRKTHFRNGESSDWTPARIKQLKRINNAVSRTVDFWTHRTLEAYVTEFTIDAFKSFSKAEREFFKGLRGKFLNSLSLRIKMLLVEKGILLLHSDC